jgi:hypothetical protein
MTEPAGIEKFLKSAGEVVAFLAALVGLIYLLGGLVIGLRLLFAGFEPGSVATIIGQLPRQLVVTTALLEAALPAAVVGLIAVMVTGVRPFWQLLDLVARGIWWTVRKAGELLGRIDLLRDVGREIRDAAHWIAEKLELVAEDVALLLLTAVLMVPAVALTPGVWVPGAMALSGGALTYTIALLLWPKIKGFDLRERTRKPVLHAVMVFGFFTLIALVPSLLLAASFKFEEAQVCTTTSEELVQGRLIGEGGGQVLIEKTAADEQWVVNLPTTEITKSEYGDVDPGFACKAQSGEEKKAQEEGEKKAEEEIGAHGGATERHLASAVRPYLFFDSRERWRPIAVDSFLAERYPGKSPHHLLCTPATGPACEPIEGLAALRPGAPGPTWIDIHGNAVNGTDFESPDPACHSEPPAVDCNGGPGAAIYYRRTGHEGLWYWDYWWFYRYNDYNGDFNHCAIYCDDHEGDWEGMVVVTTESLDPEVTGAIYAAHRDRIYVPATALPTQGSHPVAYVAKGTHATYPYACAEECHQYSGLYDRHFLEGEHDGAVAWGGNSDAACEASHCVRALPGSAKPGAQKLPHAARWAAWPGNWGSTCPGGCKGLKVGFGSSPQSPGLQIRFKCPWVADLEAVPARQGGLLTDERRYGGWERAQNACLDARAAG